MPCYHPITGYPRHGGGITWNPREALILQNSMTVPCGQCMGCRIDKKRQWATRIVHEASLYKQNSFITLTYDEQHIPPTGTLVKEHFQKFIKALRDYNPQKTIRYFHCGEYGEQSFRPHYHAILFNHDFPDKVKLDYKHNLYTSEQLSKHWLDKGYVTTGDVTLESAAYVAGYVQKKVNGRQQEQHYRRYKDLDRSTGELIEPYQLEPEYATMSRRPGIAADWFKKYHKDTYKDFITINGKKQKIPKYYDTKLYEMHPELSDAIKAKRKQLALSRADDFTPERLATMEACMKDRMSKFKRKL
jgi:hypothetical protein